MMRAWLEPMTPTPISPTFNDTRKGYLAILGSNWVVQGPESIEAANDPDNSC